MATKKKKVMYSTEFPIRCSPVILFDFLATPVGLSEWFADKVDARDSVFYFGWNNSYDTAVQLEAVPNESVKYRWDYYDEDEFFEFRITQSDVTNETILQVTDFAEKGEEKDQSALWASQIMELKHRIGA